MSVEYSYSPAGDGQGHLEITHAGGDSVAAAALSIQGTGFASVEGADQTAAGDWAGETSDGEVVEGNTVVVGTSSDYQLSVQYDTGDREVALGSATGPDA